MSAESIIVVLGFVWLILAFLIASDASKRNNSATLWFIVTLFTGLLGLIVYSLVRTPLPDNQS